VISARYLIFDLDGTLIDSSEGVVEAVNYSLRRTGHAERSHSEISRYIGYPLKQMYGDFGVGPFPELYRHFQERAAESVVSSSRLLEGADETVARLHGEGWRLAIATTKVRRHVEAIVGKFGWSGTFDVLVGGDDVSKVKPDPEAFRLAMKQLGADPALTVVVGDTVNDVLAAKAVPVTVVAVCSPYGGETELRASNPDYMIDHIADLTLLLGNGNLHRKEAP
jgi:2-phosphoglycolate phosphatase